MRMFGFCKHQKFTVHSSILNDQSHNVSTIGAFFFYKLRLQLKHWDETGDSEDMVACGSMCRYQRDEWSEDVGVITLTNSNNSSSNGYGSRVRAFVYTRGRSFTDRKSHLFLSLNIRTVDNCHHQQWWRIPLLLPPPVGLCGSVNINTRPGWLAAAESMADNFVAVRERVEVTIDKPHTLSCSSVSSRDTFLCGWEREREPVSIFKPLFHLLPPMLLLTEKLQLEAVVDR